MPDAAANLPEADQPHGSDPELQRTRETYLQMVNMLGQIKDDLAALQSDTRSLQGDRKSLDDRILQLFQRTTMVEAILPDMRKSLDRNTSELNDLRVRLLEDINKLGQRLGESINGLGQRLDARIGEIDNFVHTMRTFGIVALAIVGPVFAGVLGAIITGVYHVVVRLFVLAPPK